MWQTVDYKGNIVKWYEAELIELIRQVCEETIKSNNPYCGSSPYAMGRCITAENILDLIQENEK